MKALNFIKNFLLGTIGVWFGTMGALFAVSFGIKYAIVGVLFSISWVHNTFPNLYTGWIVSGSIFFVLSVIGGIRFAIDEYKKEPKKTTGLPKFNY